MVSAAAMALARELDEDATLVVQETEYTGAGKHPLAQLALARDLGIRIERGDPRTSRPGVSIVIPEHPGQVEIAEVDLDHTRRSYLKRSLDTVAGDRPLEAVDVRFLAEETRWSEDRVKEEIDALRTP